MARRSAQRDGGKERFWRRLLRQWRRSDLSVRDFCAEHEVSEPSFYVWRRTIAARDQQAVCSTRPGNERAEQPVFVPLRVVPTPAGMAFEVVLGRGAATRIVRVPAGFDPASLRQLLAILEEKPSC